MQRYTLLKLFGLVLLTQVILVAISFAEVFVFSTAINPGKEVTVYDAHAMDSAPWISGIFGFIVFFMVSRHWTRKGLPNALKLALLFPLVYVVWDFCVIRSSAFLIGWSSYPFSSGPTSPSFSGAWAGTISAKAEQGF